LNKTKKPKNVNYTSKKIGTEKTGKVVREKTYLNGEQFK